MMTLHWESKLEFWSGSQRFEPLVCARILSFVKTKCILLDRELWFTLEITTETADAQQLSHCTYKSDGRSDSMRFDYRVCKTKHYKYVIIIED